MIILVNKQDNSIIDTLQVSDIIDNKWVKSSNGSLIQLDMVNVVEVDGIPENAEYYKEGKFSRRHPDEVVKDAETIQKQLDELDAKSIRDSEDLYDLLLKKGIITDLEAPYIKQRKDQKKALRQQLNALDS